MILISIFKFEVEKTEKRKVPGKGRRFLFSVFADIAFFQERFLG